MLTVAVFMALVQLEIATQIVVGMFYIVLGGIVLAAALAFCQQRAQTRRDRRHAVAHSFPRRDDALGDAGAEIQEAGQQR